ncbi:YceI family protein [Pseudotamlana agarivorans]|uniref:YceI family protein n=1 Tax=Pseudotamlana agarivorans TaxID=481183 RepID=UPI00082FB746|nr:YceI family protein [Tamlana agarivorans]
MKKINNKTKGYLSCIALLFLSVNLIQAQELKLVNSESSLTIYGTSSIHDWQEDAESQTGKIVFSNLETGEIEALSIAIEAESLKSGKSGMDKNTYKALNTKKHKQITFQLTKVESVNAKGNGVYDLKTVGDLTIAGTKKSIALDFKLTVKGAMATLDGEKKIKMTQFNVDPPTAMLGAITTGDDLTIKFKTTFK